MAKQSRESLLADLVHTVFLCFYLCDAGILTVMRMKKKLV